MRAKLPALEKNILKYRALQMVLLLHQVELRRFLIGSIRAGDKFATDTSRPALLPKGSKRPMEKACQILVDKEIITEKESEGLQELIDLRNQVRHKIHELVSDILAPKNWACKIRFMTTLH